MATQSDSPTSLLQIDIGGPTKAFAGAFSYGRSPSVDPTFFVEFARELTPEDLVTIASAKSLGVSSTPLKRVRSIHHTAARMMAAGHSNVDIGIATGFCVSRLTILKSDPTFKELIKFYSHREDELFVDVRQRLAQLGVDAAETLHERILDAPEDISNSDLVDILKQTLDRAGFSAVSRSESKVLHGHLAPDEIAQIKETVRSRSNATIVPQSARTIAAISEPAALSPTAPAASTEKLLTSESGAEGTGL